MRELMQILDDGTPIVHTIEEAQKKKRCLLRQKYKTQIVYTLYKLGKATSKYFL